MIKFIPNDDTQDTFWMSSQAFSVVMALLNFHDALPASPRSATPEEDGRHAAMLTEILVDDIPDICEALVEITQELASSGLTSLATQSLLLLTILPKSSGVRIELVKD